MSKKTTKRVDQVLKMDACDLMSKLPQGCVDLVVADPPYNIGYKYESYEDDRLESEHYLAWCERWIGLVRDCLADDGTFWLIIGQKYASELDVMAKQLGFHQRRHNIWYFTFGVNEQRNFTNSHAHLLYYVKDPKSFTWNEDQVRVPSARQAVYGDKRASPEGRLPDDTWILRPQDLGDWPEDHDVIHVPRVAGTFKARAETPNQIPERIVGRMIRLCSDEGDLVFDPFCGSGTTAAVAKKLGRRYLTCDLGEVEVERARARVEAAKLGDPLDAPLRA